MKIAIKELFGNRWRGSSVEKKSTDEIREFDGAEHLIHTKVFHQAYTISQIFLKPLYFYMNMSIYLIGGVAQARREVVL